LKGSAQILGKLAEIPLDPALPADQDMVGAGDSRFGQHRAGKLAETSLHPVADHRIAHFLGDGEAEPHRRIAVRPHAHQQDEAGHGRAKAAVRGEKLRAAGQLADFGAG
jgi:hypothetical protein